MPPDDWDESWDQSDLVNKLRLVGDLGERETLADLFDVGKDSWEVQDNWERDLDERKRFEILDLYRQDIEAGRQFDDSWGLEFERDDVDIDDDGGLSGAQELYRALMGDGYDIDYAHYNQNLAYRSTVAKLGKAYGFEDMRTSFTTPRQIRAAKAQLEQPGYDWDEHWVKNNAMPYNNEEIQQLEDFKKFNQTRHFDPETNITTYLDSGDNRSLSTKLYEARAAGNYKQLTEPGAPQNLNIVAGSAPTEAYNSEGTRVVTDGDVRAMYTRYLGRDHSKLVDTNIDPNDPSHDPTAIGKDEIAYWEQSALDGNWTYDDLVGHIKGSAEASKNIDRGKLFYNTNAGKEAEIRGKLTAEPAPLNPPNLTIRKVTVKRPDNIDSGWQVPGV